MQLQSQEVSLISELPALTYEEGIHKVCFCAEDENVYYLNSSSEWEIAGSDAMRNASSLLVELHLCKKRLDALESA